MNRSPLVDSIRSALLVAGAAGALTLPAGAAHAGNVEALREGSLLTVFGSSAPDNVLLLQTPAGDVVVLGFAGTTVNGGRFALFRRPDFNAIEVRTGDGADRAGLSGITVGNDLFVNLGAGDDQVFTTASPSTVGNNFTIEGEAGRDTVRLQGTVVGQDLSISGGIGVLDTTLENVAAGNNLTVIGDLLDDAVRINGADVAQTLSVETKSGNDTVTIASASAFLVSATVDEGLDTVALTDVEAAEDITVSAGTQADEVSLLQVAAGKNLTVLVDTGDDFVTATNASAVADAVFDGGDGLDTLVDDGITGGEKKEIKDFETIL